MKIKGKQKVMLEKEEVNVKICFKISSFSTEGLLLVVPLHSQALPFVASPVMLDPSFFLRGLE